MTFKTKAELESHIRKRWQTSVAPIADQLVATTLKKRIQTDVYGAYEPTKYERRKQLAEKVRIKKRKGYSFITSNERPANGFAFDSSTPLAAAYTNADGGLLRLLAEHRPNVRPKTMHPIANTIKELEAKKPYLFRILKESLRQ